VPHRWIPDQQGAGPSTLPTYASPADTAATWDNEVPV